MLKLCDLGTAIDRSDAATAHTEITPYLVSRFYRAPEVILGSEFSFGIDMWSIGCTLFELYCGRILFSGSTNNQMLRVMQECRGKLPNRMLKKAAMAPRHFDETYVFYSHEEDKVTKNMIARPIPTFVAAEKSGKDLKSKLRHLTDKMSRAQQMDHDAFVDLLDKCLQLDPERRIDPKKALMHHFFSRVQSSFSCVRDVLIHQIGVAQRRDGRWTWQSLAVAATGSARLHRGALAERTVFPLSRPIDNHENIVIKKLGVEQLDWNHAFLGSKGDHAL